MNEEYYVDRKTEEPSYATKMKDFEKIKRKRAGKISATLQNIR